METRIVMMGVMKKTVTFVSFKKKLIKLEILKNDFCFKINCKFLIIILNNIFLKFWTILKRINLESKYQYW